MEGGVRRRKVIGSAPKRANAAGEKSNKASAAALKNAKPRSLLFAVTDFVGMLVAVAYLAWMLNVTQTHELPIGKGRDIPLAHFSEARALMAVREITGMGVHPFGSMVLEYVTFDTKRIVEFIVKLELPQIPGVDLELEWQMANSSWVDLEGGHFTGKTVAYHSLQNLLCRVSPSKNPDAKKNAILVSTHLDGIKFGVGAGDSASSAGVMVELVRNVLHFAEQSQNAVIFLWNTGEEEGLMGSHAFITQHPWAKTVRVAVDLEAMGVGGKSSLFQAGPEPWLLEQFCQVAPRPSALMVAQDIFASGLVGSATDFQVYRELGGLSGLDFAYMENPGVYHTALDVVGYVRNGSLQHLGDNTLALLKKVLNSSELADQKLTPGEDSRGPMTLNAIYFDVLGRHMFVVKANYAQILYLTIIAQSGLLLAPVLTHPRHGDPRAFFYALVAVVLAVSLALLFPLVIAFIIPLISYFSVPYVEHPWLAIGLFAAPAISGAVIGHGYGRSMLVKHLDQKRTKLFAGAEVNVMSKKGNKAKQTKPTPNGEEESSVDVGKSADVSGSADVAKSEELELASKRQVAEAAKLLTEWESERWLHLAGLVFWLCLLVAGAGCRLGSTYLAFAWLISPALAYGLLDSTTLGVPPGKEIRWATVLLGMVLPLALTAESAVKLPSTLIVLMARLDRNPGEISLWVPNAVIALFVGFMAVAFLVYMLPLAHRSGGTFWIAGVFLVVTAVTLGVVVKEEYPAFGPTAPRPLVVVSTYPDLNELNGLRVNWRQLAKDEDVDPPLGVLTVASLTPGKLTRELANFTGLDCRYQEVPDLVTTSPRYACTAALKVATNVDQEKIHEIVTDLEVLSDVGPGARGAARWREGLKWWVPSESEEEVVEGERGGTGEEWVGGWKGENDEWTGYREGEVASGGGDERDARVTRVGISTGVCRRINIAIDATRIASFSLAAVNGTTTYDKIVDDVEAVGVKGWHQLALRVRFEIPFINHFILKLTWHSEWPTAGSQRPLLRIRNDFMENYPQDKTEADDQLELVLAALPKWTAQFGKSSLPFTQAYVDALYLD